jgi:hypothetical protein
MYLPGTTEKNSEVIAAASFPLFRLHAKSGKKFNSEISDKRNASQQCRLLVICPVKKQLQFLKAVNRV